MSLTTEQHTAISTYAQRHGRSWKADLRHAWMNGYYSHPDDDSASLQQIRNTYGPSWLVRFRVSPPTIPV